MNKVKKRQSVKAGTSEKGDAMKRALRSGSASIIGVLIVSAPLLAGLVGVYWYRAYYLRKMIGMGEKVVSTTVNNTVETKTISALPKDHINYEVVSKDDRKLEENKEVDEDVELDDETQKRIKAEVARHVSKVPIGEIGEN